MQQQLQLCHMLYDSGAKERNVPCSSGTKVFCEFTIIYLPLSVLILTPTEVRLVRGSRTLVQKKSREDLSRIY